MLRGHSDWVLAVEWAPHAMVLASGDKRGQLILWSAKTGKHTWKRQAHKKWITGIAWEPMHKNPQCNRLVTASKDGLLKIWNISSRTSKTLTGHQDTVQCVRWGREGFIYSAGRDRLIHVWN